MSTAGLQRSSPLPLYHQLKEILLARTESGDLQPGDRLPGEHDLCRLYGVSRTVVRQALGEHEHEGRAIRRRGRELCRTGQDA